jgi:hypothetical protein
METEQQHIYEDRTKTSLWRHNNGIFMETEQRHLYGDRTRSSLWRHNNGIIMETIRTALWRERNKTLWKQKTKHYRNRKQIIIEKKHYGEREQRHLYGDRITASLWRQNKGIIMETQQRHHYGNNKDSIMEREK